MNPPLRQPASGPHRTRHRTPPATATTVTLVTGDKVTVTDLGHGRKTVTVRRPEGATGAVRTQESGGAISTLGTGRADTVRGGARIPVGLGASYVARAAGTGTLAGGRLEVSYDDGATWHTVSLRASAEDDRGGSVTQEIVRAVAVR
ncbi:hypothetical protein [Streptomyces monashensis]|uniref:hypothetical protein n=1 Tax=Streptomyces monashensis TaxID=1678012 RepID=UPI003F540298